MREILFRGKDKHTNDWIYGGIVHQTDYYGIPCNKYFIIDGTDTQDNDIGHEYEVIPETVGQYTGLKDKNGKMIFEGDIIKDWEEFMAVVKYGDYFGPNLYCSTFYMLDVDDNEFLFFRNKKYEVIGNVFDNPELIENERATS